MLINGISWNKYLYLRTYFMHFRETDESQLETPLVHNEAEKCMDTESVSFNTEEKEASNGNIKGNHL